MAPGNPQGTWCHFLFRGGAGTALELFDTLAENAEAMQTWSDFMRGIMAQEPKQTELSVTL